MEIALINKKGGVGKTPIATTLAIDLNLKLLSNDDSVIEKIYEKAKITNDIKFQKDTVFDFGGFVDKGVIDIISKCSIIVVPVNNEIDALNGTIKTIAELIKHNKNILIVGTRIEDKKDFEHIKTTIKAYFDLEVLELKKSKIFKIIMESGKSLKQISNDGKLNKYLYKSIFNQYKLLLKKIEEK